MPDSPISTKSLDDIDFNEPGRSYTFSSPLADEYFEFPPLSLPAKATPILDDELGMCIGYSVPRTTGVWAIYDANGQFTTLQEAPLEAPLFDPTDVLLLGFSAIRLLRGGARAITGLVAQRGAITLSTKMAMSLQHLLRGRLKVGLSVNNLKFTSATARHMLEAGRHVPVQIIEKAIRYGTRTPDPRNMLRAFRYEAPMSRIVWDRAKKEFVRKNYRLEVVVRETDWTVVHFQYKP